MAVKRNPSGKAGAYGAALAASSREVPARVGSVPPAASSCCLQDSARVGADVLQAAGGLEGEELVALHQCGMARTGSEPLHFFACATPRLQSGTLLEAVQGWGMACNLSEKEENACLEQAP